VPHLGAEDPRTADGLTIRVRLPWEETERWTGAHASRRRGAGKCRAPTWERLFAATAGLSELRQALEDHRLAAKIEAAHIEHAGDHVSDGWRALLAVGQIAAPLWRADALVDLAGAFYDAEAQSHPDRPSSISPCTHDLVAALLSPVEDIIADVTAALADPQSRHDAGRPATYRARRRHRRGAPLPIPSPSPTYAGLATGARRLHTAAAADLAAAQAAVAASSPPDWLAAGLRRLDGELQATGARLDMAEVRLAAALGPGGGDYSSLASVCRDLWAIVGRRRRSGTNRIGPAPAAGGGPPTRGNNGRAMVASFAPAAACDNRCVRWTHSTRCAPQRSRASTRAPRP